MIFSCARCSVVLGHVQCSANLEHLVRLHTLCHRKRTPSTLYVWLPKIVNHLRYLPVKMASSLLVSLLQQQPNDQPNYALQQTTAYMYLSSKSNGFALSLPSFFPRTLSNTHTNNGAHQKPYTYHTPKHFQNAKQCY